MSSQAHKTEAAALLGRLKSGLETKKLSHEQLERALTQLKVLGRDVGNVSPIYDEAGIKVLGGYAFGDYPSSISQESLRCIANALLLLPSTRRHSLTLDLDKKATDALQDATIDEEFLLSRILFLLTYDAQIDLPILISDHRLVDSIIKLVSRHAQDFKRTSDASSHQLNVAALSETLKLLFNITSQSGPTPKLSPVAVDLFQLLNCVEIPSPPLQPPVTLLINALANIQLDVRDAEEDADLHTGITKLAMILEESTNKYSSAELDSIAIPLLTVLRNANEKASPELRNEMKARLLPDDKERDQPLGQSSSLASRLLRLTTSPGLLNLSQAISGLMFELSDKDASQYVKNVGYGYAAGYLMTHKIPIPREVRETGNAGQASHEVPINPITGQRLDREPIDSLPEMTPEEKGREAERLFVLFERLKATGVVDVKNPVEQARDEGRFEELSDSDPD